MYRFARQLSWKIYKLTQSFHKEEMFWLRLRLLSAILRIGQFEELPRSDLNLSARPANRPFGRAIDCKVIFSRTLSRAESLELQPGGSTIQP